MATIYIDPGHGEGVTGQPDPGAVGPGGLKENTVTFDVAQRLGHLLRAKGYQTVGATLGAAADTENLNEAISAANAARVDLFVSLHCNAAVAPSAHGVEVWHGEGAVAKTVASAVLRQIISQLAGGQGTWVKGLRLPLTSRGAKRGKFAVLKRTTMPAILVELAFISNPTEEAWLTKPAIRQQFAQAIADGIAEVFGKG